MDNDLLEHDLFGFRPKKKGINSKKKGDKNENVCSATFLLSWTGERFIRVPSSGGRRLVNNSSFCGDVVAEDENFKFIFSIETKHLKTLGLLKGKKLRADSKIFTIWRQCTEDAIRAKKHPLAALRQNRFTVGKYLIVVDRDLLLAPAYTGSRDGVDLWCYWSYDVLKNFPYKKAVKYYGTYKE